MALLELVQREDQGLVQCACVTTVREEQLFYLVEWILIISTCWIAKLANWWVVLDGAQKTFRVNYMTLILVLHYLLKLLHWYILGLSKTVFFDVLGNRLGILSKLHGADALLKSWGMWTQANDQMGIRVSLVQAMLHNVCELCVSIWNMLALLLGTFELWRRFERSQRVIWFRSRLKVATLSLVLMPNLQRLYHVAQSRQGLIDVLCLINSVDIMLSNQFFAASQIYECELRY